MNWHKVGKPFSLFYYVHELVFIFPRIQSLRRQRSGLKLILKILTILIQVWALDQNSREKLRSKEKPEGENS